MSLIVETGSGLTNAESYCSVADADTYHAAFTASTVWSGADMATKERMLRLATQYLDLEYGARYRGYKTFQRSLLLWPRAGVEVDEYLIGSTEMPLALKQATAEVALRILNDGSPLQDVEAGATGLKMEDIKVGPIEVKEEYLIEKTASPQYPQVLRLIEKLLNTGNFVDRG